MAAASGSEITCKLDLRPIPALSAQCRVFTCAASDHTAGTVSYKSLAKSIRRPVMRNVTMYSIGVERKALSGILCRKTCSVCLTIAWRKSVQYFSADEP